MEATEQFDEEYFRRLAAARTHWWVQGMQDIAWALLDESRTGLRVLDAGCGTGVNFGFLVERAAPNRLWAIDAAPAALRYCASLGLPVDLLQGSVTGLPFDARCFDLVVSIDVIQHLDTRGEAAALAELHRVLRNGGRLLVRTNSAFGRGRVEQHDDWRLYSPATLASALTAAGLTVEALTSANALQGLWASLPSRPRVAAITRAARIIGSRRLEAPSRGSPDLASRRRRRPSRTRFSGHCCGSKPGGSRAGGAGCPSATACSPWPAGLDHSVARGHSPLGRRASVWQGRFL